MAKINRPLEAATALLGGQTAVARLCNRSCIPELAGVTQQTVYHWIYRSGRLPHSAAVLIVDALERQAAAARDFSVEDLLSSSGPGRSASGRAFSVLSSAPS